jgi:TnpA family transposase
LALTLRCITKAALNATAIHPPEIGNASPNSVRRSGQPGPATARQVSVTAIERGWDDLVRLAASIRAGKVSAAHAIHRLGSAAAGDPLHRASEHLGRLPRTLFLCDYLAIPDYRREIHTLLNRGESVHQLQRAIHGRTSCT